MHGLRDRSISAALQDAYILPRVEAVITWLHEWGQDLRDEWLPLKVVEVVHLSISRLAVLRRRPFAPELSVPQSAGARRRLAEVKPGDIPGGCPEMLERGTVLLALALGADALNVCPQLSVRETK